MPRTETLWNLRRTYSDRAGNEIYVGTMDAQIIFKSSNSVNSTELHTIEACKVEVFSESLNERVTGDVAVDGGRIRWSSGEVWNATSCAEVSATFMNKQLVCVIHKLYHDSLHGTIFTLQGPVGATAKFLTPNNTLLTFEVTNPFEISYKKGSRKDSGVTGRFSADGTTIEWSNTNTWRAMPTREEPVVIRYVATFERTQNSPSDNESDSRLVCYGAKPFLWRWTLVREASVNSLLNFAKLLCLSSPPQYSMSLNLMCEAMWQRFGASCKKLHRAGDLARFLRKFNAIFQVEDGVITYQPAQRWCLNSWALQAIHSVSRGHPTPMDELKSCEGAVSNRTTDIPPNHQLSRCFVHSPYEWAPSGENSVECGQKQLVFCCVVREPE